MPTIVLILAAVLSYCLGNFSTGAFIAARTKGLDIRQHGSGSAGTTNVLRVLDRRAAFLTFLGDISKGILAAALGYLVSGHNGAMLCGFLAIVGHIFPAFMGFRGGKGVATSLGVILLVTPLQFAIIAAIAVSCILLTRYVSLADMLAALAYALLLCPWALVQGNYPLFTFALSLSALVIFAHRSNIGRLLKGTENRLDLNKLKR